MPTKVPQKRGSHGEFVPGAAVAVMEDPTKVGTVIETGPARAMVAWADKRLPNSAMKHDALSKLPDEHKMVGKDKVIHKNHGSYRVKDEGAAGHRVFYADNHSKLRTDLGAHAAHVAMSVVQRHAHAAQAGSKDKSRKP